MNARTPTELTPARSRALGSEVAGGLAAYAAAPAARSGGAAAIWVTGSSGFIGSHLCRDLGTRPTVGGPTFGIDSRPPTAPQPPLPHNSYHDARIDIRDRDALSLLAGAHVPAVIHLAARAEVAIPFDQIAELCAVNVAGTANVVEATHPERFIFASSSAVYGSQTRRRVSPNWRNVNPVGSYGVSKMFAEIVCRDWAAVTGGSAVILRLGNVIGTGCRGFVPYLVRHAVRYPDGTVAAECRGGGNIVRDYVPVSYVVTVALRMLELRQRAGVALAFNVGSGRAQTNREVAAIVQSVLREQGYRLRINWANPLMTGEALAVVLSVTDTVRAADLPIPRHDEVVASVEEAALSWIRIYGEESNGAVERRAGI